MKTPKLPAEFLRPLQAAAGDAAPRAAAAGGGAMQGAHPLAAFLMSLLPWVPLPQNNAANAAAPPADGNDDDYEDDDADIVVPAPPKQNQ